MKAELVTTVAGETRLLLVPENSIEEDYLSSADEFTAMMESFDGVGNLLDITYKAVKKESEEYDGRDEYE